MEMINERVKVLKFTSAAVGISFLVMLFVLISMGVPWYEVSGTSSKAQLFFSVSRNDGWSKDAGDPTFAFVFLTVLAYLVAIYGTYLRWAGRTAFLPSTWQAVAGYYGASAFLMFLSFCIYAGKTNGTSESEKGTGNFGGGFALAIIMWMAFSAQAALIWFYRNEVDEAKPASATTDEPMQYATNPVAGGSAAAAPLDPSPRWRKLKAHSSLLGADLFLVLLLLIAMGAPWWTDTRVSPSLQYGLIETHARHPSGSSFRKAGDGTFPFLLFALLAQVYSVIAITLRFLGRTDQFTGRIPHTLLACMISTGISCFCNFLAWCIYCGTINAKLETGLSGHFGGGVALTILNWLMLMGVLAILHFKKDEVNNAPAPENPKEQMYPPPAPQAFGQPPAAQPYGQAPVPVTTENPYPAASTYHEPDPSAYAEPAQPNPNYGPSGDQEIPYTEEETRV